MHTHREFSRSASRLISRIERYRQGPLAGNRACRFTPTCSRYAEDALRARPLPAALVLIAWRLLRCNPFMHRRVADPVRRTRRWAMRPNTLPTLLSMLALTGFVVVVAAGVAEAVGVNNGCTATLNGKDPAELDSDHPLVVHKHGSVQFTGTIPSTVASPSQVVSNTHIDVDYISGVGAINPTNHPGHGPQWGGTESVDKYLKYAVGIYHVTGHASGTGGWSCDGDAYVKLEDGNPLGKPVGGAAAGVTLLALLGAAYATRAPAPEGPSGDYLGIESAGAGDGPDAEEASEMVVSGDSRMATLGCLALIVIAIGAAFVGKDLGAAAAGGVGLGRGASGRRVWSHGHPILGFISGLLLGIGITVLMQQFAVWPLTIVTAIVFPVVTALICSLRAWLGKSYRVVAKV